MASTGDPSTFTFTMDAFPGYTFFNPNKKVLCAMQILEDSSAEDWAEPVVTGSVFAHHADETEVTVFPHVEGEVDESEDSVPAVG